jgi:hypothetical protein
MGRAAAIFALAALLETTARAQPLGASERAIADAIPDEATPEPEEHYLGSNEWRHDLYFDALRDLGGAFVGVGADQAYTMAAVQNASLVFLVDYDGQIPRLHRMYGALIAASDSPADLLALFERDGEERARAILAADPELTRLFRRNRSRLRPYLRHVARLARGGRPTSWLSDPVLYARVRALFTNGRVVARTGDVTGAQTMRAVGDAARRLNVIVRAVYFSNAEQFFHYTSGFSENVRALPTDARSVVLRTFRHARNTPYPDGDSWHYMVHPMPDFLERLALGYRRNTHIVMDAVRAGLDRSGVTAISPETPRDYIRAP